MLLAVATVSTLLGDEPAVIPKEASKVRLTIPSRPLNAVGGAQFQRLIAELPRGQREAAVLREVTVGNVPDFLRRLKPIQVEASDDSGAKSVAIIFVMPDVLAVGSDDDFFRAPMTPHTATTIADQFAATLLTTKVSDDLFAAAEVKLDPKPLTKDRDAVATFWQHHQIIEQQLLGKTREQLVVGHKKDVVLSNRLKEKPHRVAIYGWHYPSGKPIQPLYVGHSEWHVDYSHGIRLMSQQVFVDGQPRTVADVLNDRQLCRLLSNEGPIDVADVLKAAGWRR